MRGAPSTSERGVTLGEALIALAILAVVVLALTQLVFAIIQSNQYSRDYTVAVNIAEKYLEQVRTRVLSDSVAIPVYYQITASEAATRVDANGTPSAAGKFERLVTVTGTDLNVDGFPDYKVVAVRVRFKPNNPTFNAASAGNRSVTLTSAVAPIVPAP